MSIFYKNTLSARIRRRISAIQHSFYVDVNPDHRAAVFVVGSGRSGTNWVAEVLNYDNAFRFVGEPFNRERVPLSRNFSNLQYLAPDDDRPEFLDPARTVFEGRVRSAWTDHLNRRLIARTRIVKDVRSMLMVAWIARHFPGMPIVYVLRHPCAVAHSRVRLRWRVRPRDVYTGQPALMRDHLEPFREIIESAGTEFEQHVVDWCIENYVPVHQRCLDAVCVAYHERIKADRGAEFRRIFAYAGRTFDDAAIERSAKRSATAFASSSARVDWFDQHSPDEIRRAMEIVRGFGLDALYGDDPMPRTAGV